MKLYAYCICAGLDTFDESVAGVCGAAVRELKVDELTVLVSDIETIPATQENALAHAAVVERVMEQTTPVPFRFGTLTTELQIRNFITAHKVALTGKLGQLRGCVEMDLKVTWRHSVSSAVPADRQQTPAGPGTAFLMEKRRELLGDAHTTEQQTELSELLHTALGSLLNDEKIELRSSENVVHAKVYHLVERSKIQAYREQISAAYETRPELEVRVSGPWPPYGFANIELEFGSQFGVS